MRPWWIAVACASVHIAHAQPTPTPGESLFEEGLKLLDANQPAAACTKFQDALKLEPDELGIMLNLGLCNEQQDHVAAALVWYRRAQVRASEQGHADAESAAKEKATLLAAKVPTLELEVAGARGAATVTLDGVLVPETDRLRVEVDAGHHVVEATAGAAHARRELDVSDGDAKTIHLDLAPPAPPPPVIPVKVHLDRGHAVAFVATGGALLAGSLTLGLVARHELPQTDHLSTRDAWRDAARWGGTSMFLLGAGAVGYGAWTYFHPRARTTKEHLVIAPAARRDAIGLAVTGAF